MGVPKPPIIPAEDIHGDWWGWSGVPASAAEKSQSECTGEILVGKREATKEDTIYLAFLPTTSTSTGLNKSLSRLLMSSLRLVKTPVAWEEES